MQVCRGVPCGQFFFQQVSELNKLENTQLRSEPDSDEVEAGIEDFKKFGSLNTAEALSGGDVFKWDEVFDLAWSKVFAKQLMNKQRSEFEKRLNKIRERNRK